MNIIKEIAQLGNPVLRLIAEVIDDIHAIQHHELMNSLRNTLANTQGVGIAAPQISISKRLIIIASRPNARYPNASLMSPTLMINPSFQPLSDKKEKDWEGCLSIPSIRALVPRYTDIQINYDDDHGHHQQSVLTGFMARIFQHEVDHLEGMVYLDRVETPRDIISENEYFKQMAK